ncbi:MAG: TonB family protein [Bryobacteraceae bacterium]
MQALALVALFSVSVLSAQELAHIHPPSLASKVEPEYSGEARNARVEGAVILRLVVASDGKPKEVTVVRGLGMGLDENAINAVSNWRFHPGTKDGTPVNVRIQIEVNFRLLEKDRETARWHLARADFQAPEGAQRPVAEQPVAPPVEDNAPDATATLTFDIDEKGAPANIRVDKASDDEWARNVTAALGEWKFTPASKDGKPVVASCTMEFVRGK